ncbi:hypothetical protein QE152_g6371 [Popillia japonica]|uniref:Uncharacterized protein n=1 Tax=Popillia japonica TaxID=7064 RepID=A0AAW1MIA5_POPJA
MPYLMLSSLFFTIAFVLFNNTINNRLYEEIKFLDDADEEEVSQEEEQQLSNTDTEQDISDYLTTTAPPAVYFCLRQRTAALPLRPLKIIFLDDADEEEDSQEEEQQLSNTDTEQDISDPTIAPPAVYFCLPPPAVYFCLHQRTAALPLRPPS